MSNTAYRGRFAPSPTGDLHMGSLVAAIASYLQAKANNGVWLLRIEDIDETRTVAGADQAIIKTLDNFGLHTDEPVTYQTDERCQLAYQQTLDQLNAASLTYPCTCTRKKLTGFSVYPGYCRHQTINNEALYSIRLKTHSKPFFFDDLFQGPQKQNNAQLSGDFNIKRKDGLFCYQLAVVVDDAAQKITEIVRGIDIMDSTARQMHLIKLLGYQQPKYAHFPVITKNTQKLSKQNHAKAITNEDPYTTTLAALNLLQHKPPSLKQKTQSNLINWAIKNWQPARLQGITEIDY